MDSKTNKALQEEFKFAKTRAIIKHEGLVQDLKHTIMQAQDVLSQLEKVKGVDDDVPVIYDELIRFVNNPALQRDVVEYVTFQAQRGALYWLIKNAGQDSKSDV